MPEAGGIMIIETLFSTLDEANRPNFAPMGVLWGEEHMIVRPYRHTTTYRNLVATRYGVANVTDDVLAFVRSALADVVLPHFPASNVPGVVFEDACFWRELAVIEVGGEEERAEVRCQVVGRGWQRDFLGFNRGKNAVIEATILATRLHLHPLPEVLAEMARYEEIVGKTGNEAEKTAMGYLIEYVRRWGHGGNG
jgi:hypothetical protein